MANKPIIEAIKAGEVWSVRGDPDGLLLASKYDAEVWARELFPDEEPAERYARINYREVHITRTVAHEALRSR